MARKVKLPLSPPLQLTSNELRQAIDRLRRRIVDVEGFDPKTVTDRDNIPELEALSPAIREALVSAFGADTLDYRRFSDASVFDTTSDNDVFAMPDLTAALRNNLARSKERSVKLLNLAVWRLNDRLAELSDKSPQQTAQTPQQSASQPKTEFARRVFIVHGHDEGSREAVARFLERIGFEAIILHEQASQNRTIIEQVEAHADVGFAVVLLTADDEGYKKGDAPKPRARQNVVLELGYFVGRLGRDRVCVLRRGDVEIPSDIGGVLYRQFDDAGGWKSKLAKELEAARYTIEWDKVHK